MALAYDSREDIALAAGTLDDPGAITPTLHYGVEGQLPWADIGKALPAKATQERPQFVPNAANDPTVCTFEGYCKYLHTKPADIADPAVLI